MQVPELSDLLSAAALFLLGLALSSVIVVWFVVSIDPTYFNESAHTGQDDKPWSAKRLGYKVLGLSLVAFGVLLSVPGVPGQGLLTILVGLLIAGGSTQRRIARRMLSRPSLLKTLNGLRARYGKEPLDVETPPPQ